MSKYQPYGNVKMKGKLTKRLACGCCEATNAKRQYSEQYDAYYCQQCRKWLESMCDDPNCEFCNERPETAPLDD